MKVLFRQSWGHLSSHPFCSRRVPLFRLQPTEGVAERERERERKKERERERDPVVNECLAREHNRTAVMRSLESKAKKNVFNL
jgi:hypothetical protein